MKKKPAAYSANLVEFTPSEDRTYDIGSLTVQVWFREEDSILPEIRMYDNNEGGGLAITSPSEVIEFSRTISEIVKAYFPVSSMNRHLRKTALSKLTQEERTALGLPEPSEV